MAQGYQEKSKTQTYRNYTIKRLTKMVIMCRMVFTVC